MGEDTTYFDDDLYFLPLEPTDETGVYRCVVTVKDLFCLIIKRGLKE